MAWFLLQPSAFLSLKLSHGDGNLRSHPLQLLLELPSWCWNNKRPYPVPWAQLSGFLGESNKGFFLPFMILYCYLDSTQVPQAAFLKTGVLRYVHGATHRILVLSCLGLGWTKFPCRPDLCSTLIFANFTPPTPLSPTSEGPGLAFHSLEPERTSGCLCGGSLATSTTL